jgi:hypothetical protein
MISNRCGDTLDVGTTLELRKGTNEHTRVRDKMNRVPYLGMTSLHPEITDAPASEVYVN